MDATQGGQGFPSDPQGGGTTLDPSAVVSPSTLDGNTSADPSASQNGGVQGAIPINGATQPDEVRKLQAAIDRDRAQFLSEKYQMEQRLNQMQQFQMEQMQRQTQSNQNPFDSNAQPEQYWDWKLDQKNRSLLSEAKKEYEQTLMNTLAQMGEQNWIQQHPMADPNAIRMYNRMNGIPENNLEVGWKLMNYPQNVAQVAQNVSQQTLNNFRQPNNGAQPIRQVGGGGQPTLSYEVLAKEYLATSGRAADNWTPDVRQAFEQETRFRDYQTGK